MSRHRNRRRRYAQGRNAIAECARSGQKMRYRDLVEDGHIPGLLVHPDWYEPRHPQELPVDTSDAVALWRPAPELSANDCEVDTLAEWQTCIIDCPASPFDLQYFESTTLNQAAVAGDFRYVLEDPSVWDTHQCIFVELDGGGFFVTKAALGTLNQPALILDGITPFVGAAAIGNEVYVGTGNVPRLDGAMVYNP